MQRKISISNRNFSFLQKNKNMKTIILKLIITIVLFSKLVLAKYACDGLRYRTKFFTTVDTI